MTCLIRRLLLFAALACAAGCSPYHGPITNAPDGYREIGLPEAP